MNRLHLEISNQHDLLACPVQATRELFHTLESSEEFPITGGELSVVFVMDETIAQVHAAFMNDPSATDVITFPADPAMNLAGEIIVSVDQAIKQAKAFNEPFNRELSLYLIHGWLHLAGYNDQSDEERSAMRRAEKRALDIVEQATGSKSFELKHQNS